MVAGGYDAGKMIKGRKRFWTVDTLGLILRSMLWQRVENAAGANKFPERVSPDGNAVSRSVYHWSMV